MNKELKLPPCKIVKDGHTGATHKFCPIVNEDHGRRGLIDSSREGEEFLSNLPEVAKRGRELKLKRKDQYSIIKMASKTFRESRKIEKEREGGLGYSLFKGWFKKRDSSSV